MYLCFPVHDTNKLDSHARLPGVTPVAGRSVCPAIRRRNRPLTSSMGSSWRHLHQVRAPCGESPAAKRLTELIHACVHRSDSIAGVSPPHSAADRLSLCETRAAMRAESDGYSAPTRARRDDREPATLLRPPLVSNVVVASLRVRPKLSTARSVNAWHRLRARWTESAVTCAGGCPLRTSLSP